MDYGGRKYWNINEVEAKVDVKHQKYLSKSNLILRSIANWCKEIYDGNFGLIGD